MVPIRQCTGDIFNTADPSKPWKLYGFYVTPEYVYQTCLLPRTNKLGMGDLDV